jgi:hypothetical protein
MPQTTTSRYLSNTVPFCRRQLFIEHDTVTTAHLHETDQRHVDTFFKRIQMSLAAYRQYGRFCFLAIRENNEWLLASARIFLETIPRRVPDGDFRSSHVWAGSISLTDFGHSAEVLLTSIMGGQFTLRNERINFSPLNGNSFSAFDSPFHAEGLQSNNRLAVLTVTGRRYCPTIDRTSLDWELKAAAMPYETMDELAGAYQIASLKSDLQTVEVIAFQVIAVDKASRVAGTTARPVLFLANTLDSKSATLGYRVIKSGLVIKRGTIEGTSLRWQKVKGGQKGVASLRIPKGSIVHCIAGFAGAAHHQDWLADPTIFPNPRRSAYGCFDEGLTTLQDFLAKQGKGSARDLESGVAWLLWLLGFSTAHFGSNSKTSDGPDLLATTPQGHFLVVECTTGLLKADNKLPKLIDRHTILLAKLQESGSRHLRALPVIVTSKLQDEVRADIDQAEKLGVLVITRETLFSLVDRTTTARNPDEYFLEAEKLVQERRATHSHAKNLFG